MEYNLVNNEKQLSCSSANNINNANNSNNNAIRTQSIPTNQENGLTPNSSPQSLASSVMQIDSPNSSSQFFPNNDISHVRINSLELLLKLLRIIFK